MMKRIILFCGAFLLLFAACESCYNCECEQLIESNGQVVDTAITHHDVCGTKKDLEPFEEEGCMCLVR